MCIFPQPGGGRVAISPSLLPRSSDGMQLLSAAAAHRLTRNRWMPRLHLPFHLTVGDPDFCRPIPLALCHYSLRS